MRSRLILAVIPLLLAIASPAWARGTLDDILPQIRAQHPGRLSDAEPWTDGGGDQHYRIKWMTPEGRIIYFDADTRTGRYSGAAGDEGSDSHERRGRDDSADRGQRSDSDQGGRRSHWNGEDDGGQQGGGRGNGDWHGRDDQQRGGDWGGHGGWRNDGDRGDNGGRHHHGDPQ